MNNEDLRLVIAAPLAVLITVIVSTTTKIGRGTRPRTILTTRTIERLLERGRKVTVYMNERI